MEFNESKPIYLQIVGYISAKVRSGEWGESGRIPSVRDLGSSLGVNPNTCMRAYEYLTREGVIANSRGIGYFVVPGASAQLTEMLRCEFFSDTLPQIFQTMQSLDISIEEIIDKYNKR